MKMRDMRLERKDRRGRRRLELEFEHDGYPERYRVDVADDEEKLEAVARKIERHHREVVRRKKDLMQRKRVLLQADPLEPEIVLSDVRIKLLREGYVRVIVEAAYETATGLRRAGVLTLGYSSIDEVPSTDALAAMVAQKITDERQRAADDDVARAGIAARLRGKLDFGGD